MAEEDPKPKDKKPKKDPATEGLGAVVIRNAFYRDGYRFLLQIATLESATILILILALVFVTMTKKTENIYFATKQDGSIIQLVPLSTPNLSDSALLAWVAQSTSETLTFGFNDYKRRLQEAQRHFTKTGWAEFTKALQRVGWVDTLEAKNQVLTSVPAQAPVIESQGVQNGIYTWVVQMPMAMTFRAGSNESDTRNITLRLVIVRMPELESPYGVGIQQWVYQ